MLNPIRFFIREYKNIQKFFTILSLYSGGSGYPDQGRHPGDHGGPGGMRRHSTQQEEQHYVDHLRRKLDALLHAAEKMDFEADQAWAIFVNSYAVGKDSWVQTAVISIFMENSISGWAA